MADFQYIKPSPSRIKPTGTLVLASATFDIYLGEYFHSKRKLFVVSNLDATNVLYLTLNPGPTMTGAIWCVVQPGTTLAFETDEDIGVYNASVSNVIYTVGEFFYVNP